MNKSLDDLYNLIANGNKEIKQEIQELKRDLVSEIDEVKLKNKALEAENKILSTKVLAIERKLKKFNLIIYGVQGDELQTPKEVINILNQTLQLNCSQEDFRDIFRIGQHSNGRNRPVILETIRYELKQRILISAKKEFKELQKNGIFFAQDLAQEDYKIRKFLNKHLREARSKQYNAFIRNNILVVNGEEFTYEYLQNNDISNFEHQEQPLDKEQEDDVHEKTFSETTASVSTKVTENTDTVAENKKRKFENTPTKDRAAPKIQTRSQNKAN